MHVFRACSFHLGRLLIEEDSGDRFWITDPERTVVDVYRLRHRVGEDVAHGALREYLRLGRKPARLAEIARPCGAPLSSAIRILRE